jgi:hypothetical protein
VTTGKREADAKCQLISAAELECIHQVPPACAAACRALHSMPQFTKKMQQRNLRARPAPLNSSGASLLLFLLLTINNDESSHESPEVTPEKKRDDKAQAPKGAITLCL